MPSPPGRLRRMTGTEKHAPRGTAGLARVNSESVGNWDCGPRAGHWHAARPELSALPSDTVRSGTARRPASHGGLNRDHGPCTSSGPELRAAPGRPSSCHHPGMHISEPPGAPASGPEELRDSERTVQAEGYACVSRHRRAGGRGTRPPARGLGHGLRVGRTPGRSRVTRTETVCFQYLSCTAGHDSIQVQLEVSLG
jgi:hypothetical protein